MGFVLAIDQGTSSTRAILFDAAMHPVAQAQREFPQHFPRDAWVEHDPADIWQSVVGTAREALERAGAPASALAAIGITNQRETVVIWDRDTGQPIHNAIVWQDRRSAALCARLAAGGATEMIRDRTGLILDPYFSATKIAWMLDEVEGARAAAEAGKLAFGTIDSFLIWRLTGGRVHATDATNAARTMLYDIHAGRWSRTLCELLRIPMAMLPEVRDSAAEFGVTEPGILGAAVPILGVAGDQQAATIGQACFKPGMIKATYGTGCFALLNTGDRPVTSEHRLLTTIAYQLDGRPTYALEGSIFVAGSAVQWLRDGLNMIQSAGQTQGLAERADPSQRLIIVPAFVGLGAPWWDADCRGAVFGLTRAAGPAEFARATLESVGFQTRDLIEAMHADWTGATGNGEATLRVDGGMAVSDWTMQFLADALGLRVERPRVIETTALGAAWLAGHRAGLYPGRDAFADAWRMERGFDPAMPGPERDRLYARWTTAVRAARSVPAT